MGTGESAASFGQFGIGGPGGIAKNAENREKLPVKSERLKGHIGNVSKKANMNAKESSLDHSFLQNDDGNSSDGSNEASNRDGSHILQKGSGRTPAFNALKEQGSGLPAEKNSSNEQAFRVKTSFAYVINEDHHVDRTINDRSPSTQIVRPTIAVKTALPTANLNMVLGYWNGSTPGAGPGRSLENSKSDLRNGPAVSPILATKSSDGISSDLCLQDERELKRQRRKQANRESARRSRLRKQAEYEELAGRVELLTNENSSLQVELNRLKELCLKLSSENSSLQERVLKAQCKPGDSQIQPHTRA